MASNRQPNLPDSRNSAMSLGERIKERRKELNLTQMELAEAAGVHQRQIAKYENNRNEPSSLTLMTLAETLDVSTDWLLGATDIQRRPPQHLNHLSAPNGSVSETLIDIGIRLRLARTAMRLSLDDVAQHIGSTPEAIEAYEYGSEAICIDDLFALAELYETEPEYLLFDLSTFRLSLRHELAELYAELQKVPPLILMRYMDMLRSDVQNIKQLAERDKQRMSEMENFRKELQKLWMEATDPDEKRSLKVLLDDIGGPSAFPDLQES